MVLEYLEDTIKIDSGLLLETVQKTSAGKEISSIIRSLRPDDQEVTVETLTQDIVLTIGIDPWRARRAAHKIIRNKFVVPVLATEIQHGHDDFQRINRTKHPVQALVNSVAVEFGDMEDAFILTKTNITIGDNEGIAQTGNHVNASTQLNTSTFPLGSSTLAGLIGQAVSGMKGLVKQTPLVLVITPDIESEAAGRLNTNSDKSVLQAWDEQLKLRGGPGSGILVAENLGCTIAFTNNVLAITTTTANASLVCVTPKVMTTFASVYDSRPRPYNKADGYYTKVVERWLHLVHDSNGVIDSDTVATS